VINIIRIEEAIEFGQRIKSFELYFKDNTGQMQKFYVGTTIGHSRIITFDKIETDQIVLKITDSYASPTIRAIKGYYYDKLVID
jgi:alpha-L-fucosidase